MTVRTERVRDLFSAVLAVGLLAGAGVAVWLLLTGSTGDPAATGEVVIDGDDAQAASDGDGERAAELRIHIQTSVSLAVDRARPVLLDVTAPDGTPLAGEVPIAVRAEVTPTGELAGHLAVTPAELTTTVLELRRSRLEVAVAAGAPCDVEAGTLRIRVDELEGRIRSAEREVELPRVTCSPDLREAGEALHLTDPVCGSEDPEDADHTAELRAMLDGEDQEATWCMSTEQARELGILPERRAPEPDDEDDADDADDEDDADEDEADGDDGSDDEDQRRESSEGGSNGSGGSSDGGSDDRGSGDGSGGSDDGGSDDGGSDDGSDGDGSDDGSGGSDDGGSDDGGSDDGGSDDGDDDGSGGSDDGGSDDGSDDGGSGGSDDDEDDDEDGSDGGAGDEDR